MAVAGLSGVAKIEATRGTCAILSNGGTRCWGNNDNGQLGTGVGPTATLLPIYSASNVTMMSIGVYGTACFVAGGAVKCSGYNNSEQVMGTGSTFGGVAIPQQTYGLTAGMTEVSVGSYSACAITSAGGVKCWGQDNLGQLGTGTGYASIGLPADVPNLTSGVAHIAVGNQNSCAVTTSGALKCWGQTAYNNPALGALLNSSLVDQ